MPVLVLHARRVQRVEHTTAAGQRISAPLPDPPSWSGLRVSFADWESSVMRTEDADRVRRIATDRGLVSYMNDTKWRELCEGFRHWPQPPRFRIHDLLAPDEYVPEWDCEWYYHPRPYMSIQWLEVELPSGQIPQAIALCETVGAAAERTSAGIRIWGWVDSACPPRFL